MSEARLTAQEREALSDAIHWPEEDGSASFECACDQVNAAVERILAARLADRDDAAAVEARVRALAEKFERWSFREKATGDHIAYSTDYIAGCIRAALSGPADAHPADGTGT